MRGLSARLLRPPNSEAYGPEGDLAVSPCAPVDLTVEAAWTLGNGANPSGGPPNLVASPTSRRSKRSEEQPVGSY